MIDVTKPITITVNELSADERIELIGAIWDSMSTEMIVREPTGALKEELDRRIDAYEKDPERGLPWEEVGARIESR